MNQVLSEYGRDTYSYEEYKLKIGGGFRKLVINSLGEDTDESTIDEALKNLEEVYARNYMNKTSPYDGILGLLADLNSKGIKLAINTNKRDDYSKSLAEKMFKDIEFVDIIGQSTDYPVKPDPYGAEYILDKMNLKKEEVLYVGDSNVDVMTGKNTGLKVIGVNWGYRGEDELREYGADYIAYKASDILDIVLGEK